MRKLWCSRIVMTSMVLRRWWCQSVDTCHTNANLGDSPVAFGHTMSQVPSNVREASIYPRMPFNPLALPFGGEMLGQTAINSRPNISPCKQSLFHGRRRNESDKHGHCGMQQIPLGQIFLASLSITSGNAATL